MEPENVDDPKKLTYEDFKKSLDGYLRDLAPMVADAKYPFPNLPAGDAVVVAQRRIALGSRLGFLQGLVVGLVTQARQDDFITFTDYRSYVQQLTKILGG